VAFGLGLAVTTAAVKLAEVVDGEAGDLHGAAAVVLQDLVLGAEGSAAGDGGGLAGFLLLDGESVLADGRPPDVGQLAGAHAVHTFYLVGADDDVGERGAGLKNEHSIAVTTLSLAGAVLTTVVNEHATIEALACSNSLHSLKGRSSRRSRNAAPRRAARRCQSGRSSSRRDSAGAAVAVSAGDGAGTGGGGAALAAVFINGSDGAVVLAPLGPVEVAAAPLPALAAGVGAQGEGEDCELSVLHVGCWSWTRSVD